MVYELVQFSDNSAPDGEAGAQSQCGKGRLDR